MSGKYDVGGSGLFQGKLSLFFCRDWRKPRKFLRITSDSATIRTGYISSLGSQCLCSGYFKQVARVLSGKMHKYPVANLTSIRSASLTEMLRVLLFLCQNIWEEKLAWSITSYTRFFCALWNILLMNRKMQFCKLIMRTITYTTSVFPLHSGLPEVIPDETWQTILIILHFTPRISW